ncbi:MAG: TetR family transcriptional regulator [Acidimicrobiia bacterium]|nr:TetR family transcriptional regulator [Acidimicrobiia bacterium]
MTQGAGPGCAGERADPRISRSKAAVLAAARQLLHDRCFFEVTVEAIAEESGVAKTTIYRHWPSREALLLDLVDDLMPPLGTIDTGSLAGDLGVAAHQLARALGDTSWSQALPGLLDAAQRDAQLRRIMDISGQARRQVVLDAFERARRRGELPAEADTELATTLLAGPLFYRRLVLRDPPGPDVVERVVAAVLLVLDVEAQP